MGRINLPIQTLFTQVPMAKILFKSRYTWPEQAFIVKWAKLATKQEVYLQVPKGLFKKTTIDSGEYSLAEFKV